TKSFPAALESAAPARLSAVMQACCAFVSAPGARVVVPRKRRAVARVRETSRAMQPSESRRVSRSAVASTRKKFRAPSRRPGVRALRPVRVPPAVPVFVELLVEVQALEDELDGRRHEARALEGPEHRDALAEARDLPDAVQILLRPHPVRHLDAPPGLEVIGDLLEPLDLQVL